MEQRTIDLVHSIFCKETHTHKAEDLRIPRKPNVCYYYLEGQVEHGENMEDHKTWIEEARDIADTLALTSDNDMIGFLANLNKVIYSMSMLKLDYPESKEILKLALEL